MKLISWNLLHREGAAVAEVARLIEREQPDALLMQEVTAQFDELPRLIGGSYSRTPLPGRRHGLAIWTAKLLATAPTVVTLPAGAVVRRVALIADLGPFSVGNVHLSHSQLLNRKQLRHVADHLPAHAAVLGDYNLVGPPLLPGFQDVGPRAPTHRMSDILPLRLDRCVIRGLICQEAAVLDRAGSDHHPIMVRLTRAADPQPGTRGARPFLAKAVLLARQNAGRFRRP
ncbi:endonuclease/exonuclease/phosphatase family protein [Acidisoma cellulosilytica]|uniref:Endonuclease/exonuclease/phosphatase family protein n=1 Tax=Acidisoma cellulosilyticum TaxID=2802395 RepID=A0A963YYE7_9PROT|nr:endonuclease/exonuclease/phosphatase family protein [Acidisoma cellulosilyticum]MCB8878607.1 endonuclease/exonuclease/phosphatase family protein [Acidisoma cellulosilyticum]